VHTSTFRGVPFTMALTFCRLGTQILFVRMCEWLSLMPVEIPLPQTEHFLDMSQAPPLRLTNTFYQKTNWSAIGKIDKL